MNPPVNPNKALSEKSDFKRIADTMRIAADPFDALRAGSAAATAMKRQRLLLVHSIRHALQRSGLPGFFFPCC
jgi:hypothetical protein